MSELPPRGPRDDTAQIPLPDDAGVREYMQRRAAAGQAPPDFVQAVMERVAVTPIGVPWWQRPTTWVIGGVGAAAVVAAILAVLVLTRGEAPDGVGATASPGGAAVVSGTPLATFPPAGTPTQTATASPTPTQAAATQTPAPTASATPAPTPTAAPEGPPTIVGGEEQPFIGEGAIHAIHADAETDQFVAVGTNRDGEPTAWTSADGTSWEAHAVPHSPRESEVRVMMGPMARFEDTLYSFGNGADTLDSRWILGWRTADAVTWEEIESDSEFFQFGYLTADLEAGEPGLLAASHSFGEATGETWLWEADTSWQRTTPGGRELNQSGITITDVAWGEDRFVAVGDRNRRSEGAAWVAADGRSWEESPAGSGLPDAEIARVVAWPTGGFVAVGSIGEQAVILTSDDGLRWAPADVPGGFRVAHSVATDGEALVATAETDAAVRLLTSRDGRTWADATGDLKGASSQHHAVMDGAVVVVIQDGEEWSVWRGELE
jgi:hypothetical protein